MIGHIAQNGYYNFINKFEIVADSQVSYRLKLTKITLQNLYIGFGTMNVFGNNSGSPEEGLYYYCGSGCIYSDGKIVTDSKVTSDSGDEIVVEADLRRGKVAFWKNDAQFVECDVPLKMANKSVFFVLRNYYQHDEIGVLFARK